MKSIDCPVGYGWIALKKLHKERKFKGVDVACDVEVFVCPVCRLEAGTEGFDSAPEGAHTAKAHVF